MDGTDSIIICRDIGFESVRGCRGCGPTADLELIPGTCSSAGDNMGAPIDEESLVCVVNLLVRRVSFWQ